MHEHHYYPSKLTAQMGEPGKIIRLGIVEHLDRFANIWTELVGDETEIEAATHAMQEMTTSLDEVQSQLDSM